MKMRDIIRLVETTAPKLYHGTSVEFDAFDTNMNVTAKHIYTTPDPRTAAFYGDIVYELEVVGSPKIADLRDDYDLVREVVDEFWEEYEDEARYSDDVDAMIRELEDAGDEDAEDNPAVKHAVEQAARGILSDHLMYGFPPAHVGRMGSVQDRVLDEVFSKGFDAVYFADPSPTGSPVSLVWKDGSMIRPVRKLTKDEVEALPYYQD